MKRSGSLGVLLVGLIVGCGDGPKSTEVKSNNDKPDARIERGGKTVDAQTTHKKADFKEK